MPIEVRELIIRTAVNTADEKATSSAGGNRPASEKSLGDGMDVLVELLKKKNER